MKFYEIDLSYMEYLHQVDTKVLVHNTGIHTRKFIAVRVLINGYHYFVPLSSPDNKDFFTDSKGNQHVRKTKIPAIKRFFNGKESAHNYLGKLLFNNMIPVPMGFYKEYNPNLENDTHYKFLLTDQLIVLRSKQNKEDIDNRAKLMYHLKENNAPYGYIKATVNFKLLEAKCDEWELIHNQLHMQSHNQEKVLSI